MGDSAAISATGLKLNSRIVSSKIDLVMGYLLSLFGLKITDLLKGEIKTI